MQRPGSLKFSYMCDSMNPSHQELLVVRARVCAQHAMPVMIHSTFPHVFDERRIVSRDPVEFLREQGETWSSPASDIGSPSGASVAAMQSHGHAWFVPDAAKPK